MSISAAEISTIESTFTPTLNAAGPLPQGKTIELSPDSILDPKSLGHNDLVALFGEMIQSSHQASHTAWIDYMLWSLKKPSLPLKYKMWVISLMKALDTLNAENATSKIIPAAKGVFKVTELMEWDQMARYACMDAARFRGCCSDDRDYYFSFQIINRAYLIREAYIQRYSDYLTSEQKAPGDRSAMSTLKDFRDCASAVHTNLVKAQAGICTTFAWAAAFPLIERMIKESRSPSGATSLLKRVEVAAYPNHIFVIVNRAGDTLERNEALPANTEWGDDVFEVDVWYGSLGHPTLYKGTGGNNAGFLQNLKSIFDSHKFLP